MHGFVVKASLEIRTTVAWLTTPRRHNQRTFGPRHLAAEFPNWDMAELAIREIRKSENCDGIAFEVRSIKD
jgi:hypothetical protein